MTTATADEGASVNEEPPLKKIRLDEQPSLNSEDPAEDKPSNSSSPIQLLAGSKGARGKHKFAMLLSYCGKGYFGMQRNPGVRTIEEDLIQATYKAGAISEDMRDNLGKMFFQRCARTDKGVSAVRQVVSLKLICDGVFLYIHMYEANADRDKINAHLPPQIRVIAIIRVTKKFSSKDFCVARSYEYLLPTYALSPTFEQTRKDFRITSEQIERVNQFLSKFVGTHNFHNFTSGKSPSEASAKRYIKEFCCGKTIEADGIEFIVLRVKGQSFMLHQIRKMIGLTIAIVRNIADEETLMHSFENDKADIPMAPGLGLMLENVFYDGYNKRYGSDGTHSALNWDHYHSEIEAFKNEHIYNYITKTEYINGTVMNWLGTIPLHSFDKKTQTTNVAVDEGKEKVEHKTAELTNTPTGENHNV